VGTASKIFLAATLVSLAAILMSDKLQLVDHGLETTN